MTLYLSVKKTFFYLVFYMYRTLFLLGLYTPQKQITYKTLDNEYIDPLKSKFDNMCSLESVNDNIEPIFYDKEELTRCLKEENNHLETIWKSRVLIENTSRGNVIMYYDAYKMGFTYYCDKSVVSYDVLNAVAMKYSNVYRCRDFFMDEACIEGPNKLMKIHFEKDEKPKKMFESTNYMKSRTNPNKTEKKENKDKKENEEKTEIKQKNKFIYAGKINNYAIIQTPKTKPKKVYVNKQSDLLKGLEQNTCAQLNRMSYKDFKQRQLKGADADADASI